jgi:hypothetical protein
MRENTLDPGQSRTGFVIDGNESTPHMAATLSNESGAIRLTVPWNDRYGQEYRRWFFPDNILEMQSGDDYRVSPIPEALEFADPKGTLILQGCRDAGAIDGIGVGMGRGTIEANHAIVAGHGSYSKVNGLRSEIAGLGDWFGTRSIRTGYTRHPDGRLRQVTFRLESPDQIRLHPRLNLTAVPSYLAGPGTEPDTTVLRERTFLETLVDRPRSWDDHLTTHRAIRDLLSISSWRACNFASRLVCNDFSPGSNKPGAQKRPTWCEVIDQSLTPVTSKPGRDFLFAFADVGRAGIARWLSLQSRYARAVLPMTGSLYLQNTTLEARALEVGVGLEALGYQLALDTGTSKSAAGRQSFRARLERIVENITIDPPFPVDQWIEREARAYNGLKHADRDRPENTEIYDAWRMSVIIFRLWVASVVCGPNVALGDRLYRDHLARRHA